MRKYPEPEEKPEPWPLGMVIVDSVKPVVDDKGNPIPEEKEYARIGKR